mmetsp:Transcript_6545/g.9881  ORF Transcript_6545/g.9881 Transcript_6545/m.9881 type:complete len:304 (-) Transcript_6545:298-1209(-)|eukprot:CAMPEP_0113944226 /NCGR_PEP_ID=MMETSP1339-20121228/31858_1 /TAXON_ID=94617 /ORGANISM="Fibrocapsa japonica" /LENGTH=303 /DNA_ID=CAMNT_0000949353 /DNA_START=43 /DNA_END=954 /DNA_ORIENTATION=+ /assembly_acc=CAM_ASM_000762
MAPQCCVSKLLTLVTISIASLGKVSAFSISSAPVSSLLAANTAKINSLRTVAQKYEDAPLDDMFYLRYCLNESPEDEMLAKLEANMKWRTGEGKSICSSAKAAVEAATSSSSWDNKPVRDMAPHASIINKYITPSQCLTTTTRRGDLAYCIRAGKIDDVALMSEVTREQVSEFFIYCREVNNMVANIRSLETDRLVSLITVNDVSGVKVVGGDANFRKALGASSKQANDLYPALTGPTLLVNLPTILSALAKLFTPLFPKEVRKKIKFAKGPLSDVTDLMEISPNGGKSRAKFLDDVDRIAYE